MLGVLAGVEDEGELARTFGDRAEAGDEFIDHLGELGDIGAVAGIGMGDERDAAVSGDDEARGRPCRRSVRFCLAWPRWAIGARSFPESM